MTGRAKGLLSGEWKEAGQWVPFCVRVAQYFSNLVDIDAVCIVDVFVIDGRGAATESDEDTAVCFVGVLIVDGRVAAAEFLFLHRSCRQRW